MVDIKKELKEIIAQIVENKTVGHDDAGENGVDVVVLDDFSPTSDDSTARDEEDFVEEEIKYNGWFERLKQLSEIV